MRSAAAEAALDSSTTITTQAIKRICVERGFYRNPICNEKLYLHQKGFDSIDVDAFEPYTNVKVLWLESNALTSIACGKDSQVNTDQVPTVDKTTAQKNSHVDCAADWTTTSAHATISANTLSEGETKPSQEKPPPPAAAGAAAEAAAAATHEEEKECTGVSRRDVFRTLYPTLRQLYLHNNALREMPDLSGFQRLDSVNLSGNTIRAVRAHCAAFRERVTNYKEAMRARAKALLENSKSMQREERECSANVSPYNHSHTDITPPPPLLLRNDEHSPATRDETNDEDCNKNDGDCAASNTAKDGNGNSEEEVLSLEEWRQRVGVFVDFCPHEAIEAAENGKLSDDVPLARMNPCSSIRTLNLACNFLTGVGDLIELLCYKFLATLDLSYNRLHNGEGVLLVLERLPRLRSLKLCGNPLVRSLPRYRKTVLARCSGLLHLDDRPVFADERRLITAWVRGGEEEECRERQRMREEKEEEHVRRLDEFRAIVGRSVLQRNGEPSLTQSAPLQRGIISMNGSGLNDGEESATSSEQDIDSDSSDNGSGESESGSGNNGMSNIINREEEEEEGEVSEAAGRRTRPAEHSAHVYGNNNNNNDDVNDDDDDDAVYVPLV